MKNLWTYWRKILMYLFLFEIFTFSSVYAAVVNIEGTEPPIAKELIFRNRSVLSCGITNQNTILTYLDVKALLIISNTFSQQKVNFTTDWQNLKTAKINLNNISSSVPDDMLIILLLCLNWEDTKAANLYTVSEENLNWHVAQLREKKPWSVYSEKLQNKINSLPDENLKRLVHMVLRAKSVESVQGPLIDNPSLKLIPYRWLL